MTDSLQQKTTTYGHATNGKFLSGSQHPRASNLKDVELRLSKMDLGTRRVVEGSIRREKSNRKVDLVCKVCKVRKSYWVDSLLTRKSKNCLCQRNRKYHDQRAHTLGVRYDAMVQRCNRWTHVSSHRYKGRGIKVLFESREQFIRWALEKFPDTDFKGLDFDRIDNDGDYEPENLRLATRSENLRNR